MKPKYQIALLTLSYLLLRLVSSIFETGSIVNSTATLIITASAAILLLKKNILGWYLVATEIILGGTGNFFQFSNLSLRSWLLVISLMIFFFQDWKVIRETRRDTLVIGFMLVLAGLGMLNGLLSQHSRSLAIADAVPYLFLLYYFPLRKLLADEKWKKFCLNAVLAAIIGQTLFVLFTFYVFTTHYFILQDTFYHWYRDIATGKITNIEFNFYRLVLNEQLLLVPILLWLLYQIIYPLKSKFSPLANYLLSFCLLILLALNLTRVYFLALAVGLLIMFTLKSWKRWLAVVAGAATIFLISFSLLFLVASNGASFGLEVFGLRLQSIVSPEIESSSLSRLLLLPKIGELIKIHPFIGSGLGTELTVYSPVLKQTITTSQFDWGYFEIIGELGFVGLLIWLIFILKIFQKIKNPPDWRLASLASLVVINITSPALFHVLGVTWLVLLLALPDDVSKE